MTELTITPKVADKTARFKGTIAAGEHVAVTIKGGAEWIGTDGGANLTLRVLDLVTGRTLAVFPYWTEDNQEDWPDGLESADAWAPATDDANDLYCELNLNTLRMVAAARHMLRVPVMFVLGDTDGPRTLYFRDRYEVEYWPERIGDTVPYDLDKWPKQIDEWAEQVAAWTSRMDNLALDAERVDGGVKITLNDGTLDEPKEVMVNDGEVSADDMNAAIAAMGSTKQNTLTFDDIPTEDSENPVKSGGVYGAVNEVVDDLTDHTGNTGIHVTTAQKEAWTAKYGKPQDGIPKSDLSAGVQASLGKADTAVQVHQSLDAYVNAAGYDPTAKEIQLKHDSTVVARIDATAFIKDGMVDSVEITGGNLVISFNTDAGIEDIEIPLTDIFNPSNYYDKTAADGRFVQKEAGKGLVAVDATLTTSGAAADAKAVGDALRGGFTEWVCDEVTEGYEFVSCEWEKDSVGPDYNWCVRFLNTMLPNPLPAAVVVPGVAKDSISLSETGTTPSFSLSRHLITPTKTSQLTNDGAPNGGGTPYATTAQIPDVTGKADKVANAAAGNLAALDAQGNLADSGVKPSDFAAKADLPYALVVPGEWEFSDGLSHVVLGPELQSDDMWHYVLDYEAFSVGFGSESDALSALSIVFRHETTITATRPSLPGHLLDRAGNRVVVTGDTTLTLPAAVAGYLRDFLVRLEISGSTVPTITFQPDGNESVTYETDGDEFPVPDEAGDWLYSFTENCVAHKFAVSLKKVNTVAQAAQGGS